jgi:hypothetical protein
MLRRPRYHHPVEISQADKDALLARYAATHALIEEALVACETGMVRVAVQKTLHAIQDVRKLDAERERLEIAP